MNQRGEHLIGQLLAVLTESGDESPEEVLAAMLLNAEPMAQCAAARLLLASAPLYSDKAPPQVFQILREEVRACVSVCVCVCMYTPCAILNHPHSAAPHARLLSNISNLPPLFRHSLVECTDGL